MHSGNQNVNDINEVNDGAFMGSATLVPVTQDASGKCKRVKCLCLVRSVCSIKFHSWRGSSKKTKSKMGRTSKETKDLLHSIKYNVTAKECMLQFNNIHSIFNSSQNQYFQLRQEDGGDTWFKDIDNWVFEF